MWFKLSLRSLSVMIKSLGLIQVITWHLLFIVVLNGDLIWSACPLPYLPPDLRHPHHM